VGEDVIQRLFDKIDDLKDEVSDLSKKVVALETTIAEREKNQNSIKGTVAWVVTTAIAIYGALKGVHT
jgi:uncharacterized protein YoxC